MRRLRRLLLWLTFLRVRERMARRYLHGAGLEIGALHLPLRVPRGVVVTYVDAWTADELRAQFPELAAQPIVDADVIDEGTQLTTIADRSQDFVIANHFLEHCEDPIGALETMLRVTRPHGILYLAVPDKRRTFDRRRPLTSFEHLVRDHELGPEISRAEHWVEWARLVEEVDEQDVEAFVDEQLGTARHIHFHVWTHETLLAFFGRLSEPLGFELLEARSHRHESIVILRVADRARSRAA